MKAAQIMVRDADGHEWQYGLYAETVAATVVRGIDESTAGQSGSRARVEEWLDVGVIEPTAADGFETDFDSRHRVAWRAMERARRDGCRAYAVHGRRLVRLEVHRGSLGGRICYSGPRYMIEGREYVLCRDGHFDASENRDKDGRLTSYCEAVVAAEDDVDTCMER